uniref:Thioredoxin domain-containing protein n=1 Tax=Strombidium rassoulzadegani TaxID=1082188 RepID=A0A7S3CTI2_9SPIT|mmetsp:Transcript_8514/g.14342  ORF Transcript_8514/g.14342 Transcript_8514/m.14342 type:complete len:178 (+) Transcript_8514:755-1288(+)
MVHLAKRSIITQPGKNFIMPENAKDIMKYLDQRRPVFTCIYFRAQWNPICEQIEQDYERFAAENSSFTHIKVDCDATPQVKFFFDARVEPQFIFLLNGAEIQRQVGFNFNLVESHLRDIEKFHYQDANYFGDSGNQWERFYDQFDRFEKHGQDDRDAFRIHHETIEDQHRGPGTMNP